MTQVLLVILSGVADLLLIAAIVVLTMVACTAKGPVETICAIVGAVIVALGLVGTVYLMARAAGWVP